MKQHWKIVLGFLIANITLSVQAGDELSFKGYVDAQHQCNRGNVNLTPGGALQSAGSRSGFVVNSGALYLSKSHEAGKFMLDLPFTQNAAAGTFNFATSQAQAYVEYKYEFGLSWRAGQFDTMYGFEGNDSPDNLFTRQGLVYGVLPVTHTGLLLTYPVGNVSFNLLYGNANQGGTQTRADSPEVGAKVGWSDDRFRASSGVLVNKREGSYGVGGGGTQQGTQANQIIDVLAGATFNKLKVDVGYDIIQPREGKVLNPSNLVTDKKNTQALFSLVSYDLDDKCTVGLRYENVKEDASNVFSQAYLTSVTTGGVTSGNANGSDLTKISLAFRHKMTKELWVKADVSSNSVKATEYASAESTNYVDGAIAAVYSW